MNIQAALELAEQLDRMDEDVTSWEADFLESILVQLRQEIPLTVRQETTLMDMVEKYLE